MSETKKNKHGEGGGLAIGMAIQSRLMQWTPRPFEMAAPLHAQLTLRFCAADWSVMRQQRYLAHCGLERNLSLK